jgi:predicted amidophosphoribosyltransferase
MQSEYCNKCRHPLEEWERFICEGCGMKSKPNIVCDCGKQFVFSGSVNEAYRCPGCKAWCAASASGMEMLDINDTLSFRIAVTSLWWKHRQISESLERAMQSIPIIDQPSISAASAKAILNNMGSRDTDKEEAAVESYMQRFFS